ncbi:MAG: acetylglutamate kinase [Flavobacteriales bacterium]|nr:acetylglutamate kinase [Flavobacteriales bacterium]MCB9363373.1 acetylglutamate kinase [Flavobacteriales bacterium]
MKPTLKIIKIGGNLLEDKKLLHQFVENLSSLKSPFIIVHGGGKTATQLAIKLGNTPKMIDGRRITSKEDLDIAAMVYAGLINKKLVALLQNKSINAIGLSGADANTILSEQRPVNQIDYGLVGDVKKVNSTFIHSLTVQNICPVFCAITHNGKGQLLNTNADTIAAELAIGMSLYYSTELVYCFEKNGVLMDVENDKTLISEVNLKRYQQLKNSDIIYEGMIPKIDNCFYALKFGVSKVQIGNIHQLKNNPSLFTSFTL